MNPRYVGIIFVGLMVAGIAGINTVPHTSRVTLQTVTTDGVTIFYDLYQPNGVTEERPVVIIGHGIMVNKEMMTTFAVELVAQGYIVANLDWRGHGQSTGTLSRDGLLLDLEAVVADIPRHAPADMERIALLGYSMGGFPTYRYAATHSAVKAWVGVGTAADSDISTVYTPHNVLIIIAQYDEAFSPERAKESMVALTGVPLDEIEFEKVYGTIHDGTARSIHVVPRADHLTTPWNSDFVETATFWIGETFEKPPDIPLVFHKRAAFLFTGLTGLIGFLCVLSWILAEKLKIKPKRKYFNLESLSARSFIGKYYVVTLLLFFSMGLFLPLFLTPLPFTAFLAMLTGGLGINVLIYCWVLAKKGGNSIKTILKENLFENKKIWIFSVVVTVVFMVCYYFLVGLHYLGIVPSVTRVLYVVVYCSILFLSFLGYSLFIQKGSHPFLEKNLNIHNSTITFLLEAFIIFILIYSWFCIIVLIPCIVVDNYFLAMILILMVPIFLFMSFFGVYMERVTGSIVPNTVIHAVWLGLVITTLSPYGSLMMGMIH